VWRSLCIAARGMTRASCLVVLTLTACNQSPLKGPTDESVPPVEEPHAYLGLYVNIGSHADQAARRTPLYEPVLAVTQHGVDAHCKGPGPWPSDAGEIVTLTLPGYPLQAEAAVNGTGLWGVLGSWSEIVKGSLDDVEVELAPLPALSEVDFAPPYFPPVEGQLRGRLSIVPPIRSEWNPSGPITAKRCALFDLMGGE
jgi:hypothetical protein